MRNKAISLFLSIALLLPLLQQSPTFARGGFGGGGRGGGGRSFGGGGRSFGGGGRSFGGGGRSFGGGGRSFGGGGRSFGGGGFGGGGRGQGISNRAGGRDFGGRDLGGRDFGGRDFNSGGLAGMAGDRGGLGGRGGFADRGGLGARGGLGDRASQLPANGRFDRNNLPSRPVQLPGQGGGLSGLAGNRPSQPLNRQNIKNQASGIRNSFNNNNFNQFNNRNIIAAGYAGRGDWDGGWHGGYGYGCGWGWPTGAWACAGTAALGGLLGMTISALSNDDEGSSDVVYQGDTVIVNGAPTCSAEEYYNQAQNLAMQPMPAQDPAAQQQDRWEPLGVFALAQPGQTQSTMVMQLAINQNGAVAGTYLNQMTGESLPIHGSLDKNTQRLSWTLGDNPNTVFDTSLKNLLAQETSILVHYGAANTQEMLLVRLPAPQGQPQTS